MKLADNQKNKVVQTAQVALPGGMVPVHIGGYPTQAAKPHPYTYPSGIAYPNQPTAAPPPPYSIQPQISYTQYTPRKETVGAPPTGLATYPYYFTK